MLKIILVIVGIIILICLLQSLIPFLLFAGILVGVIVLCMHYPSCTPYVVGAVVLCLVYGFYAKHIKPALKLKKDKRNNKRWLEVHKGNMSEAKRDSYLYEITGRIFGKYKESVYIQETIPWGRANAFLNYFESDINKEDVYFFQPIRSAKFDDLRENGYMITNKGLRYCIESDGKRYQNMVPFYRLKVAELSIANKDLKKILPKMYQADNPEKFARKLVVDAIMSVMQRRCTITKEIENEALNIVLSELKTAVCVS